MNDYSKILTDQLPTAGNFPACFAFSIHKAGSSMMFGMLQQVAMAEKIPSISIPDILFRAGVLDREWQSDESLVQYFSSGRVYLGFRYFPALFANKNQIFENARSVLLVRDPRDALVSQYFSFKGTHVLPDANKDVYVEAFKKTAQAEIDDYVISAAPAYKKKLTDYLRYMSMANMRVFRYEDIVFKKEEFLKDIFAFFDLPVSNETIVRVSGSNDLRPEVEDTKAHVRKVTPGDHKEKLKSETIAMLNDEFTEIGEKFGYDFH